MKHSDWWHAVISRSIFTYPTAQSLFLVRKLAFANRSIDWPTALHAVIWDLCCIFSPAQIHLFSLNIQYEMIFTSTLRLYSEAQNGLILPPSKQRNSPVSLFTSEDVSHRPRAKRLPAESLFFFFLFFLLQRNKNKCWWCLWKSCFVSWTSSLRQPCWSSCLTFCCFLSKLDWKCYQKEPFSGHHSDLTSVCVQPSRTDDNN